MCSIVFPLVTRLMWWVRLQDFMIQVRLSSAFSNPYFYIPSIGWRPYWNRQRWNEYLWSEIVKSISPLHTLKRALTCRCHSEDEIDPSLRFVGAGILAMANSGPNTNGEL